MRRLDRYIFREILIPGLIALVALTFIVLTQHGGMLLDIIVRQSPTGAEIWAIVSAYLPAVLTVTLPMAVLMGILTGFSRLKPGLHTRCRHSAFAYPGWGVLARSLICRISLGCQRRMRGPHVPVPRQTITDIPSTS